MNRCKSSSTLIEELFSSFLSAVYSYKQVLCRDWMFVSSSTHIWLLQQRPISVQVDKLVSYREFELALKLTVSAVRVIC